MKKRINLTTATRRVPRLGFTEDHILAGTMESLKSIVESTLPKPYVANSMIILTGLVLTGNYVGAGLTYSITAGSVYYNGEIYQVAAASGTISGTNVVLLTIDTSTFNVNDPVLCTDSSFQYVHRNDIAVISQGVSGTGTKDYSALLDITKKSVLNATLVNQTISSTTFVDLTGLVVTTPNDGYTRTYLCIINAYTTQTSAATNATLDVQLWNDTTSTEIKRLTYGKVFSAIAGNIDVGIEITKVVTLAPNTVIKARAQRATADSIVYLGDLTLVEIR